MTPHPDVVSSIVYQAQGLEVETTICNGEIVMNDGVVHGVKDRYPDIYQTASEMATAVIDRAGLPSVDPTI